MGKCANCKKTQYLDLKCKFCKHKFCTNCLMYEIHNCVAFDNMKEYKRKDLHNKLLSEQVKEVKVAPI